MAMKPSPVKASDMTCAPWSGSYRSRTIARAQTAAAASVAPCAMRQTINHGMLVAKAAPRPATTISASESSSTGRRPKRSAIGPQTSCIRPKARISADIVICTAAIGAAKSRTISGSAGR